MAYGTVNADVIGTSVTGSNLGAGNASIMKNRLINGAMAINQRGSSSYGTGVYTLDRWQALATQSSKYTVGQNAGSVTPPAGFPNYLGVTSSSAYSVGATDYFYINQNIEGYNWADLNWGSANAKTVTLSAWVYSSLTGTFGGSLVNWAGNYSYPFTYSIPVANTWTQISVTIAGPTSGTWAGATNAGALQLYFSLGTGTTYSGTAGSWSANYYGSATGAVSVVGTSGATWYVTGVQLEVGSSATGFEYVNYQTSLANCQRYFYMAANGSQQEFINGFFYSATEYDAVLPFPVTMRTAPTLLQTTGTDYYNVNKSGTLCRFTSWSGIARGNGNSTLLYLIGISGYTAGYAASTYTNNSAALVGMSAEL